MALNKVTEIATIDVVMVTVSVTDGGTTTEYAITTASTVTVEVNLETVDAVKLIVKGVLKAQKKAVATVTGNTITLKDNVFSPELVQFLQGGTITYDAVDTDKIIGYTPPVVGSTEKGETFTFNVYTAQYDTAGEVIQYEKTAYPNCTGQPIAFNSEDGVFRAPEYPIVSAPSTGQAPYAITYIESLPTVV